MIGGRFDVDRLDGLDRTAENRHDDFAALIGDALARKALAIDIDRGLGQRLAANADDAQLHVDSDARRNRHDSVEVEGPKIVRGAKKGVALHNDVGRRRRLQLGAAIRVHLGDENFRRLRRWPAG